MEKKASIQPEAEVEEQTLQDVMAIERSAQDTIRNAQAEAQRIIEAARAQAEEMRMAALADWQKVKLARQQEARQQVDIEIEALRQEGNRQAQDWLQRADKNRERVVEMVLETVLLVKAKS